MPKPVDKAVQAHLAKLLAKLNLTVENVLEAAAEQPALFHMAGDYRIAKMEEHTTRKMKLETVEADKSLKLRKMAVENGDKMTEHNREELLLVDKELFGYRLQLAEAERGEEYAKLLLESYRMRRDSLQVISNIAGRDISMERSMEITTAKLKDARKKLTGKYQTEEEE